MLSRLMKHEWEETWKIPVLSFLIIIITTLVCVICFTRMEPPAGGDALNVGAFLLLMSYSMLIGTLGFVVLGYIAVRFYRNLYTDQGYLMHTLPVTPRQLILSKLLVGSFWYFILTLLSCWAILAIMTFGMPIMINANDLAAAEASWSAFSLDWLTLNFPKLFGMSLPGFTVFFFVLMIVSSFSNVLIAYASISLGQLFSRHKVMASILCYIGFSMVIQTVTSLALTPSLTHMVISNSAWTVDNTSGIPDFMGPFVRSTLLLSLAGGVISSVASYIISEYIMKKQLNLD